MSVKSEARDVRELEGKLGCVISGVSDFIGLEVLPGLDCGQVTHEVDAIVKDGGHSVKVILTDGDGEDCDCSTCERFGARLEAYKKGCPEIVEFVYNER